MDDKVILLVEDNADDEVLTPARVEKNNIRNEVVNRARWKRSARLSLRTGLHADGDSR